MLTRKVSWRVYFKTVTVFNDYLLLPISPWFGTLITSWFSGRTLKIEKVKCLADTSSDYSGINWFYASHCCGTRILLGSHRCNTTAQASHFLPQGFSIDASVTYGEGDREEWGKTLGNWHWECAGNSSLRVWMRCKPLSPSSQHSLK